MDPIYNNRLFWETTLDQVVTIHQSTSQDQLAVFRGLRSVSWRRTHTFLFSDSRIESKIKSLTFFSKLMLLVMSDIITGKNHRMTLDPTCHLLNLFLSRHYATATRVKALLSPCKSFLFPCQLQHFCGGQLRTNSVSAKKITACTTILWSARPLFTDLRKTASLNWSSSRVLEMLFAP